MTGIIKNLIFPKLIIILFFYSNKNSYLCKRYPEYNLFTLKKTNTY